MLGDGQLAYLLTFYSACSSSNIDGYNAYEQLNVNFFSVSNIDSNTQVGTETYESKPVTIKDKVAELEYRYDYNN